MPDGNTNGENILEGIWAVQFETKDRGFIGGGTVIVKANQIFDQNSSHDPIGIFNVSDGDIKGEIWVTDLLPPTRSLGTLSFQGTLSGPLGSKMSFEGHSQHNATQPITFNWTKILDSSQPRLYIVHPSNGEDGTRRYTDEALVGLFSAHTENLTSERETIWARYTVMVTVHTIILTALGVLINTQGANWLEVYAIAGSGVILCFIWYLMTWTAWEAYARWEKLLCRFSWPEMNDPEGNPFVMRKIMRREQKSNQNIVSRSICQLELWCQRYWESFTYFLTCFVIFIFAGGYFALVIDWEYFRKPGIVQSTQGTTIDSWHIKTPDTDTWHIKTTK